MSNPRAHSWYRVEAQRLRTRAAALKNDAGLRDSYLRLAREYERLADVLEGRPKALDKRVVTRAARLTD